MLLLALSLLAWVIFSNAGTRWALQQTDQQIDELSISGINGRVFDDLTLESLHYQSADTEVIAEDFNGKWALKCLLKKMLCIENLSLSSLSLKLPAAAEEDKEPETPFSLPKWPLAIQIKKARIDTLSILQNEQTQTINELELSASVYDSAIQVENAALTWQENRATLKAKIELSDDYPIDADLDLTIPKLLGVNGSDLSLRATGYIAKDIKIKALLSGQQTAELNASIKPLAKPLQLNGTLMASLLQSLEAEDQAIKLQGLQLDFTGDLERLNIKTKTAVTADQVPENQLIASAQLIDIAELRDINLQLTTLGGSAEVAGNIAWQESLSWDLTGGFSDIDISQYRADVSSTVSGTLVSNGKQQNGEFISPVTTMTITGDLQDRPLTADINISLGEQGVIDLKTFALKSGNNYLNAQGAIDQQLNVDAVISAPELASLWPGLTGSLSGDIKARGNRITPTIEADLKGAALGYGEFSVADLALQTTIVEGASSDSKLTITTNGLKGPSLEDGSLQGTLKGTLSQHSLDLVAKTSQQSAALQLAGALTGADWNGSLDAAQLAHQKIALSLQAPAAISWKNDLAQVSVSAHCWLRASASLCLQEDATISADAGEAMLAISDFNLGDLNPLLPRETKISGLLQADIDGRWTKNTSPFVKLKTEAQKLALQTTDPDGKAFSINFNQAELDVDLDQQVGDLKLRISSPQQGRTQIDARVVPSTKRLTGSVNIEGFLLQPLKALLPMLDKLQGEISAKGVLSGELTDPNFKGRVQLSNPAISGATIPLTIDGGKLTVDVDGRDATLNAHIKTLPTGSLNITGDVSYQEGFLAKVKVVGEQLAVILPPTVDATVNHNISLLLNKDKLTVRGKVHVPDATIVLEGIKGSGPSLSKDLVLTDAEDQGDLSGNTGTTLQTDLDIQVQVDDDVRMSGYGFDTRLEGDIKIRQRVNQPIQLAGELSLQEGSYHAYGQDLTVRRGELLFVGPVRATRLDVDAYRTTESTEAGLILEGTLLSPVTTLYSDPAMSDADVLSHIVLGGPPGQGGDESALLARAALNLGLKNGNRIAGQFASAAGIQDFNIGADGKGENTGVILSGRVSPKLLLSYRIGIFDAVDTLTARYDLNQELYLELMRGVDQAIDLFYTFDY